MGRLAEFILPKKRDFKYELALESSKAITNLFKLYREGETEIPIDENTFVKIFPNDPNSPAIYWMDQKQYIIRYPAYAKPYSHNFKDKCKFVEVLSGKLFDANSHLKLFKGDTLKITPKDNYAPYTLQDTCYLRVCIGDCSQTFEQACK